MRIIFILAMMLSSPAFGEASPINSLTFESLKSLPIQHGGRIKPLDTFSREVSQTVTGRTSFQGISSIDLLFSWLFFPEKWINTPFIRLDSIELKEKLGLSLTQKHFSPIEIRQS